LRGYYFPDLVAFNSDYFTSFADCEKKVNILIILFILAFEAYRGCFTGSSGIFNY